MPEDVIEKVCTYCGRTFNYEWIGWVKKNITCCQNTECEKKHKDNERIRRA
jgi:hypothetical protein